MAEEDCEEDCEWDCEETDKPFAARIRPLILNPNPKTSFTLPRPAIAKILIAHFLSFVTSESLRKQTNISLAND
jgi:hypothetical protein